MTTQNPLSSEVAFQVSLVLWLVIVILALGTTAPLVSVMVPKNASVGVLRGQCCSGQRER